MATDKENQITFNLDSNLVKEFESIVKPVLSPLFSRT